MKIGKRRGPCVLRYRRRVNGFAGGLRKCPLIDAWSTFPRNAQLTHDYTFCYPCVVPIEWRADIRTKCRLGHGFSVPMERYAAVGDAYCRSTNDDDCHWFRARVVSNTVRLKHCRETRIFSHHRRRRGIPITREIGHNGTHDIIIAVIATVENNVCPDST